MLEHVTPLVRETPDYSSGYELAIRIQPESIFVDLGNQPDQAFALIEQLYQEIPDLNIFVISKEKNPDLILRSVRLGVRDFFVLPGDEEVIQRTIVSLRKAKEVKIRRGHILAVFSLLGGCGTTTLATNLAAFLAQNPEKQCIICDFDLYKGDVSYFLNLETDFTIVDFLKNLSRIDEELLHSSLGRHQTGLFVLSHPRSFEEIEDISGEHVTRVLQTLRAHFDFIVVDSLKAINDIFLAIMDSADTIILVGVQTVPALKNIRRCLDLFEQLGYDKGKIKLVLNRFTKEKIFSVENIEKTLDWPISATLPFVEQEATEAMNAGRLLLETFPKSKLTVEISELSRSLTGEKPKVEARRGLIRFFRRGA
jgi:pilus assembly protein CpaE